MREDGRFDLRCLRRPAGQLVRDYERDYAGLDAAALQLLVQQLVARYREQ